MPGDVVRDVQWAAGPQCYTIDLPGPGALLLAVSTDVEASIAEPWLDVFECRDDAPSSGRHHVRDRWASSWLGDVWAASRYGVCVAAQDPAGRLASFKLTTAFAERLPTKDGDPDEDEPEPEGLVELPTKDGDPDEDEPEPEGVMGGDLRGLPTKDGDPDEDEPEPEGVMGGDLRGLPTKDGDPDEDEPEPEGLVGGDLCRAVAADDHSDLFRCATALMSGETLDAEIRNVWGDDEDVFTLRLDRLSTVRIVVSSAVGIRAALHDRFGNRLSATEVEDASDSRLTKTLVPGRYFVRVTAPVGVEGAYRLQVESR